MMSVVKSEPMRWMVENEPHHFDYPNWFTCKPFIRVVKVLLLRLIIFLGTWESYSWVISMSTNVCFLPYFLFLWLQNTQCTQMLVMLTTTYISQLRRMNWQFQCCNALYNMLYPGRHILTARISHQIGKCASSACEWSQETKEEQWIASTSSGRKQCAFTPAINNSHNGLVTTEWEKLLKRIDTSNFSTLCYKNVSL